jgi:hypothetical protein
MANNTKVLVTCSVKNWTGNKNKKKEFKKVKKSKVS